MLRALPPLLALLLVAACDKPSAPASTLSGPAASAVPARQVPIYQVVYKTESGVLSATREPSADGLYALTVSLDPAAPGVALPVAARSAHFSVVPAESTAGDPLAPVDVKALVSGEEERRVATWLRAFRAGPGRRCVLAEQGFGFEHIKRNHTLVCAHDGQQAVVWASQEGPGPTWSSIDVKDLDGDGLDELIHYEGFASPEGAEKLDAAVWSWSGSGFIRRPGASVGTLTAGTYRTAELARKARNAVHAGSCRNLLWVVQTDKGRFALLARTTADARALAAWKEWQACYPGLKMDR